MSDIVRTALRKALLHVLAMVVMGVIFVAFICYAIVERGHSPADDAKPNARNDAEQDQVPGEPQRGAAWYEGGTLHDKTALDWQTASEADKLATSADFVSAVWTKNDFVPKIQNSIQSTDDMKPYAEELVKFLDQVTVAPPGDFGNDLLRRTYEGLKVKKMAESGMKTMDWIRPSE